MKRNSIVHLLESLSDNLSVITPFDNNSSNEVERVLLPFDSLILNFINEFSKFVMTNPQFREFPELITLAFWMREGNIQKLNHEFSERNKERIIAARGCALHFAPANVDTIFIYSLFLSLLVANKNIVRVSTKSSPQQVLILKALSSILEQPKFAALREYIVIVTYEHNQKVTEALSNACDVRIIWGGDNTITQISSVPIPPKAIDIKFANKYSYAIFGASELSKFSDEEIQAVAKSFINDSYWFGQMGCSSPRNVYWIGEESDVREAQNKFWKAVELLLENFNHNLSDSDFMNKFVAECDSSINQSVVIPKTQSKLVSRVTNKSKELFSEQAEHCGGGLFFEDSITELSQLGKVVNRKTQTITYAGLDRDQVMSGIKAWPILPDRVVPSGEALAFDKIWDGHDLLESFARFVTLK